VLIAQVPDELKDPDDIKDYPPYGAPKIAGDHHDDDGQIFDDSLKANPDLNGTIAPNAPGEVIPPKPTAPTQLRAGTMTLTENDVPRQLLNYDPKRIDLSVWVTPLETEITTSQVYLASDPASLAGASVSALINVPTAPGILRLECHNGELWAKLPEGSELTTAQISWIATTK
jgi:hypothetical protein